jgi:hypothetical protein
MSIHLLWAKNHSSFVIYVQPFFTAYDLTFKTLTMAYEITICLVEFYSALQNLHILLLTLSALRYIV